MTQDNAPSPPFNIADRTFEFAVEIVSLCRELDKQPGAPRLLANQLFRSGTSVGANMEEAQAGQSRADFRAKCSIALKECRETHYWLRLLSSAGLTENAVVEPLLRECNELVAILTTIVRKLYKPHG